MKKIKPIFEIVSAGDKPIVKIEMKPNIMHNVKRIVRPAVIAAAVLVTGCGTTPLPTYENVYNACYANTGNAKGCFDVANSYCLNQGCMW